MMAGRVLRTLNAREARHVHVWHGHVHAVHALARARAHVHMCKHMHMHVHTHMHMHMHMHMHTCTDMDMGMGMGMCNEHVGSTRTLHVHARIVRTVEVEMLSGPARRRSSRLTGL